ncbi:MAG: ABC transporter substrate-binding protein, partial [Gammaproteobacteria bacterium]
MPIIHNIIISIFFILLLVQAIESPAIEVIDDAGRKIFLEQPAQKIISLSPHITELIFSAGAGEKLSGVDDYSNYPKAAKSITRIGDANHLDIETILSLQPDLIVAWGSGQSHNRYIQQLIRLQQTV